MTDEFRGSAAAAERCSLFYQYVPSLAGFRGPPLTSDSSRSPGPAPAALRSPPPPGKSGAPGLAAARSSLATRLAALTFAVVSAAGVLTAAELAGREHQRIVAGKRLAVAMAADVMVSVLAPAVDFGDPEAARASLEGLRSNQAFVYAGVWAKAEERPLAELRPGASPLGRARPALRNEERLTPDFIELQRLVRDPGGASLGVALFRASLAAENAELARSRRAIFLGTAGLAVALAFVLLALVRRSVVAPLQKLASAARKLARGEQAQIETTTNDEIGMLGQLFNRMSLAITDREKRLREATRRVQGILDHTGQAILLFGADGRILEERSHQADVWFGSSAATGERIVNALLPSEHATQLERDAFEAWIEAAASGESDWEQLASLAPSEAVIEDAAGTRNLSLDFRGVEREEGQAIMLLATDVTDKRRLERSVEEKDREGQRQVALMRRLLSGGAQAFARFLEEARGRLARARVLLAGQRTKEAAISIFHDVHSLRAEARGFALSKLERELLDIEGNLVMLRSDSEFVPKTVWAQVEAGLGRAEEDLEGAEALFIAESPIGRAILEQLPVRRADVARLLELTQSRDDEVGAISRRLAARPFGEATIALLESIPGWAERAGKEVQLVVTGKDVLVPEPLLQAFTAAITHLVRNAIAHGIESPEDREKIGKYRAGQVEISCRDSGPGPEAFVIDDGAGLDLAALRTEARRLNLPDNASALELASSPGLSTFKASQGDPELAGRGVGLGAVRAELARLGYHLQLDSQRGVRTQFSITRGAAP